MNHNVNDTLICYTNIYYGLNLNNLIIQMDCSWVVKNKGQAILVLAGGGCHRGQPLLVPIWNLLPPACCLS